MSSKPLSEIEKDQIVRGLLSLRSSGRLQGVWLNEGKLYVREIAVGPPEFLPWKRAVEIVGFNLNGVQRKPVQRETFKFTLAKGRRA
jgi:hypothetical protein